MLAKDFRFLSVPEAAAELGVSVGRVRKLLREERIVGQKLGIKTWAIPATEVKRFKKIPRPTGRPPSEES